MYRGVVIEESLADRSCLGMVRILRTDVVAISEPAVGQPSRWTLTRFEVDDTAASELAAALSDGLVAGPWYVDFNDGAHSYVVFAGRICSYARGDTVTLDAARAYAQQVGVPDGQIDWAVPG